jgi:3-hydroxyisobutyrate dehydrogenase-like beta-hydroxyacid dehydrogenase
MQLSCMACVQQLPPVCNVQWPQPCTVRTVSHQVEATAQYPIIVSLLLTQMQHSAVISAHVQLLQGLKASRCVVATPAVEFPHPG